MLIDWFTIGAQALNFLILVWLMKRFLYQPILHAIDAREKRIAAELADADTKKAEAKKERDEFQRKNEELDQQRAAILNQVTNEAKIERQRLFNDAHKEVDALAARQLDLWMREQQNLNDEIKYRMKNEVFAITRKALRDLAESTLEERMSAVLIRRLRELNSEAKTKLGKLLTEASDPVLVRSAFDLLPEQREAIQRALNEMCSAEIRFRFETLPDLVSGIELTTHGQRVAWNIADYFTTLEKSIEDLFNEKLTSKLVKAT